MKVAALVFVVVVTSSACAPTTSARSNTHDEGATDRAPLTDIVGLPVAEDLDPADDVVEYALEIAATEEELLPGQTTPMWTYNGSSPGPLLRARVGDAVRVHVTNHLDEATTVHWHGLRVTAEMDGVAHDGALAIDPGETFTYELVPPDAGTFWYHPHLRSSVQIEAGLYGVFVVEEDPALAPDVDADRVFVLDDVRLEDDGSIAPESGDHMDIMHGRFGNVLLVNGSAEPLALALGRGRVERWRLVNTANARTLELRLPGLQVREIGADGGLWPQGMTRAVEELVLPVGARAELEVRLAEGSAGASLDAAVLVQNAAGEVVEEPIPLVTVEEDAAAATDDPRRGHHASPTFEMIDPASEVTDTIALSAASTALGFTFTVNGQAWPDVDMWTVGQGELRVIEIVNEIGPEHPFHLHGQFFQVLRRDDEEVAWESGWRDTVLLPGMRSVVVATRFENPGMWMYHCHILEHAEHGMMGMVDVVEGD